MLNLFALAALTTAQSSPTVIPAPPPPVSRVERSALAQSGVVSVRVRVAAGGELLFNDSFRLARNAAGSYQESRSEAAETVCPTENYYTSQDRYSLSINAYLRDNTPAGPAVQVNVRWQRPTKLLTCGGEGSREVQLTQTVPLAPGQSVTLQGDAGLTVTISR